MSYEHESAFITFTAGAAIAQHRRVKLSAGKLALAGADDDDLGTLTIAAFADGDARAVRTRNDAGSRIMCAAGVITLHAPVYQAANGKVAATGTRFVGYALEAAGADGDLISVLGYLSAPSPMLGVTATGLRLAAGTATLDGSGPTPVTTGLTTILSATASVKSASPLGDDIAQVAVDWSGGTLNLYPQEHNGTDPTLVASNSVAEVCWIAVGV